MFYILLKKIQHGRVQIPTYDQLILCAIVGDRKDFQYHNHSYEVRKNEDDLYEIFSNGEKVADAIYKNAKCEVAILEDKKEYVRNTRSKYYEELYKNDLNKVRTRPYPEPPKSKIEFER